MKRHRTRTEVKLTHRADLLGAVLDPRFDTPGDIFVETVRDAARMHVDDSAYRPGSIQQCARPFQDLDAIGNEGVYGGRVVGAGHGHVQRVEPVFHDSYARAGQSTDNRTPSGIAE